MNKKHLILPSGFLILLMLLIAGTLMLQSVAAETIPAAIKFDPNYLNLGLPAPAEVAAIIRFPSDSPYTVKDIDPDTVLLEGSLPPTSTSTYPIPGALVAEFDGDMVASLIWAKIYHVGVPPNNKVYLTVTGKLYESKGGTPFSGQGYIKVTVPNSPPPP